MYKQQELWLGLHHLCSFLVSPAAFLALVESYVVSLSNSALSLDLTLGSLKRSNFFSLPFS